MTVRLGLIVAGALALLAACDRVAGPAAAETGSRAAAILPTAANRAAADYMHSAIGDELFEVRTADIASVRATDPAVRAYARLMAKDYRASASDLRQAMTGSGQTLGAPALMSEHLQSLLGELGEGTGRNFDKTYIDQQIEAQTETLGLTSAYAQIGDIPAIKAAAGRLASTVQTHLDQARAIEDRLNKTL